MTRDIDQFVMPLKTWDEFRADYNVQDDVVRDLRVMHGLDGYKEIDQLLKLEYTHYVQRTLARRVQDHVDYAKWEIETDVDAAKDYFANKLQLSNFPVAKGHVPIDDGFEPITADLLLKGVNHPKDLTVDERAQLKAYDNRTFGGTLPR